MQDLLSESTTRSQKQRTGTGCYTPQSHPPYPTKLHKEVTTNKWLKSLWQRNEHSAWLPPITSWLSAGNCICAIDSSVIFCCGQFPSGRVKALRTGSAFKGTQLRSAGVCKHWHVTAGAPGWGLASSTAPLPQCLPRRNLHVTTLLWDYK